MRSCSLQPTTVLLGRPREASALGVAAIRNTTALYREPQKRLNPQWVNGLQQAPEKGLSSPPPRLPCYLLDITRVPSLALGIPLLPIFQSSSSSTLSVAMGHRTPTRWCWANPVVRGMPPVGSSNAYEARQRLIQIRLTVIGPGRHRLSWPGWKTRVNIDNVLDEGFRIGRRGWRMNSMVKDQTNKAELWCLLRQS
jgi:hypothetical protein